MIASGTSMSPCMLQAVLLRMCEKRLLQSAALFAYKQRTATVCTTSQSISSSEQGDVVGASIQAPPVHSQQVTNDTEGTANNEHAAIPNGSSAGSSEDAGNTRTCVQQP